MNLRRYRIENSSDEYFQTSWEILEESFPPEEIKSYESFKKSIGNKLLHNDIILLDNIAIGILFWYDFKDFRYIGHFATTSSVRGNGIGQKALLNFLKEDENPVILEVEKPELAESEDDRVLRERRVSFYLRNGLRFNPHPYAFPAYDESGDDIPLYVLSYPDFVSAEFVEKLEKEIIPPIL